MVRQFLYILWGTLLIHWLLVLSTLLNITKHGKKFSLMDPVYSDINSAFCTICKTQFSTGAMNSRAPGYDIFVFVFLLIILLRDNLNLDSCISLYIHYI